MTLIKKLKTELLEIEIQEVILTIPKKLIIKILQQQILQM